MNNLRPVALGRITESMLQEKFSVAVLKYIRLNPLKWFIRLVRGHDDDAEHVIEGVTMGWSLKPTRSSGYRYTCRYCHRYSYSGGYVIGPDRELHPDWYEPDGWPIDPNTGKKLEIAAHAKLPAPMAIRLKELIKMVRDGRHRASITR